MSNINSRVNLRRVSSGFGAVLLFAAAVISTTALFFTQNVGATAVPSGYATFVQNEKDQPPSGGQAADYSDQLNASGFTACTKQTSYIGGAVNGKNGAESYISMVEWLTEAVGTSTGNNRANSMIQASAGELNNAGIQLEASGSAEGFCTYLVKIATDLGIPIKGSTVTVDQSKAYVISKVAELCTSEFNEASEGFINGGTQVTEFLNGLSDSQYTSKVRGPGLFIDSSANPSTECGQIVTNLEAEIAAAKEAFCTDNPDDGRCQGATGEEEDVVTCTVDGIGWIVCPVLNFMAGIVDAAYGFVGSLLAVQPLLTTGETAGIYGAWQIMRTIANIAFVIAFLVIIFSQLTGVGISNYGVKKMLPRLVIAAILVNVSYWICAIAVDASNILGVSVKQVFDSLGATFANTTANIDLPEGSTAGPGWEGLVALLLAGGAGIALYVGLSALIPAVLAALIAILTVFIVLTLRQALIILLIVISPLAFVAYLLPNTEDLFTKWRKFLMTLLLMYPIIAAIFGASAFASSVVMLSADGEYKMAIQIMGAAIAILPLALTPVVMKTAGGVLNRFAGIVNNTEKGPMDRIRKAGEGYRDRRQNIRGMRAASGKRFQVFGAGQFRRKAKRDAINANLKAERAKAEQQYIADAMTNKKGEASTFAHRAAGGNVLANVPGPGKLGALGKADAAAVQGLLANAKFTIEKAELEEVKAEHAVVDSLTAEDRTVDGKVVAGLRTIVENKGGKYSDARVAAAVERLTAVGSMEDVQKAVDQYATQGKTTIITKTLSSAISSNGFQSIKAPDLDNIANGRVAGPSTDAHGRTVSGFTQIVQNNVASGVLSQEKMVSASNDELRYVRSVATVEGTEVMRKTAAELKNNETLRGKIKHNRAQIDKLAPAANDPAQIADANAAHQEYVTQLVQQGVPQTVIQNFQPPTPVVIQQAGVVAPAAPQVQVQQAAGAATPTATGVQVGQPVAQAGQTQQPAPTVNAQTPPAAQNINVQAPATPVNVTVQTPQPNVNVQAAAPGITITPATTGVSPTSIPTSFTAPSTTNPAGTVSDNGTILNVRHDDDDDN